MAQRNSLIKSFGADGAGGGSVRTVAGAVLRKEEDLARQKNHKFSYCPKISVVVPAYRTPEIFLRQMIESLEKQSYENWELVIEIPARRMRLWRAS